MNMSRLLAAASPSAWLPYDHLKDPRTQRWPLVATPLPMASLLGAYLLLVRYLPRWMAGRQALQLRPLLLAYNAAMALLNAHICRELAVGAWQLRYSYLCQPHRVLDTPPERQIAAAVWWFYFSKCLEFADTIFFMLRKKSEQVSFLHVYHHATMFPIWWLAVRWVPTGSSFFPALINAFVHIIMYSYYAMSALGGRWRRYLWWKRHLTKLQLAQFTLALLWSLQALATGCAYPRWICWTTTIYMISFLILFARFYARKYLHAATDASTAQRRRRRQQGKTK